MNLPKEAVIEFQKILKEECGIELEFNDAEIRAKDFLNLRYLITTKNPIKNDQT
jgi:hypothetical protein